MSSLLLTTSPFVYLTLDVISHDFLDPILSSLFTMNCITFLINYHFCFKIFPFLLSSLSFTILSHFQIQFLFLLFDTMGGKHIRHEANSIDELKATKQALKIFNHSIWTCYFEQLCGFDEAFTTDFAIGFQGETATVHGLQFHVDT